VINSTELGEAQLTYLKARAQADLQARSVERAPAVCRRRDRPAELQRRESELSIASAEQRGGDQLRVLGMSSGAINKLGRPAPSTR
jgi:cobalt-zinc-cadmium efflux system membrane fusion protein